MTLYRDSALVLRGWKLGESDRIVSMLGENSGKIRAVVKGVRKTKSKFGARLEPLSVVSLLCWKGRELDVVSQAETIEIFRLTREDLDRLFKANVILELIEQVAQEEHPDPELYRLAIGALRVLDRDNPAMLLSSFIWKLLDQQGYRPNTDRCAVCGSTDLVGFDSSLGGALCEVHCGGRKVSTQAVSVIAMSLEGKLSKVLQIVDPALIAETEVIALAAVEATLDRRLRSLRSVIEH